MYLLYSLALALALLLSLPWWLLQMARHGKYRAGLGERLGRVPARVLRSADARRSIWVHAVSVGEVLAVSGVIAQLRERFPEYRVVISTTTAAGQKLARTRFGEENVFYFPLDFGFAIAPWLRALRPALVVLAETEFWPNFLRRAREAGAEVAVVNARISDRSLPRYRRTRKLMRRILAPLALFLAQSEEDARRLVAIGGAPDRVRVSGNLKFDVKPPAEAAIAGRLRAALERSRVIVCGSTVEGEEAIVLEAFKRLLGDPDLVLVLAPRHPERFAQVAELVRQSGLPFWLRSQWTGEESVRGGVFLLDSIGELASIYALAQVAFVGGSLVPRGGHNILEPAYFGVPIIVGPHTGNFRDIIEVFRRADAVLVAHDAGDLESKLRELLADDESGKGLRSGYGQRAAEVMRQNAGATARTMDALAPLLAPAGSEVLPR